MANSGHTNGRLRDQRMSHAIMPLIQVMCGKWHRPVGATCLRDPYHTFEAQKTGLLCLTVKAQQQKWRQIQMFIVKVMESNLLTWATHCGSSDASASASQS